MGLYQKKEISQLFTFFTNTILQYFHLNFPSEKIKIMYKTETRRLHNNLKNDIKIRDELYTLKGRSPTPEEKKL